MFVIYLGTKLYLSSSNNSLVTTISPKAKLNFRTASMSLFHILQKYYFEKNRTFFLGLLSSYIICGPESKRLLRSGSSLVTYMLEMFLI